jgi:hypothetical protein
MPSLTTRISPSPSGTIAPTATHHRSIAIGSTNPPE